ncbi:MAG TPA: DEAD/DEAH box helicase [Gammaproteobacteria bacterium]|nr:DEAD/DEAH box helicase [Gammaproteobacteria bacterium]
MTFASFNLHPQILSRINALGYQTPTPIQKQSIPSIMEGQDLVGLAQTGTGKTAAFVLPMLQRLMKGSRGQIRALIITPTRELAQQVHEAISEFSKDSGLRSAALYGGVNINPQKIKLRRGVDIAVACPGRLLDHVSQRTIDLSKVEMLVLDEADHMFDMGFLPHTRRILQLLPKKRQSLLFSATMPQDVRKLADEILNQPITVQISNTAPVKSVTQVLYPVSQKQKTDLLMKILHDMDVKSTLIFTRTKHRAEQLAEELIEAGYSASSIQGNLSQYKRQKALNNFRKGALQILVATDIASRGIDIAGLSHVINYDMPDTVEAYTHRIGRTGRATNLGDAFTLITREDSARVRTLERVTGIKLEQRLLPDFAYETSKSSDTPRKTRRRPPAKGGYAKTAQGARKKPGKTAAAKNHGKRSSTAENRDGFAAGRKKPGKIFKGKPQQQRRSGSGRKESSR